MLSLFRGVRIQCVVSLGFPGRLLISLSISRIECIIINQLSKFCVQAYRAEGREGELIVITETSMVNPLSGTKRSSAVFALPKIVGVAYATNWSDN